MKKDPLFSITLICHPDLRKKNTPIIAPGGALTYIYNMCMCGPQGVPFTPRQPFPRMSFSVINPFRCRPTYPFLRYPVEKISNSPVLSLVLKPTNILNLVLKTLGS